MLHRVRVWDLPTRIFHWTLFVSVIGLVVTAKIGGNAMVWHFRLGYVVLALLLFRLIWGLVGGRWSRFSSFIHSPRTLLRYLRGEGGPELSIGHSPLGAGSVFALLAALLVQVLSGLTSDDEIAFAGPLSRFVSNAVVGQATWYHKAVGQWLVIGLVVLHIAAVLYYLWRKKQNLLQPMVHGDKQLASPAAASRDDGASRMLALVLLLLCGAAANWISSLGG
ncbi:cytochrome b/b6 domain-containing protein [Pseudorhodoferax sp. Leaf267]|uniref:cytochrome b/b6 domain-containing protein n=1 Tax=Pseudorhodoferax sp. Leaf267 TaxID=1736316 RepID=UPI0006FE76EA|nr:cytochrome b/b6 domain-containing protein [Pseudorhodoferax sp. Leaf267]KQP21650.1 cytochrome B [Pseudorhodoferax sp. Leaf267]